MSVVQPVLSQSPQSLFGGSATSDAERQLIAERLENHELKRKLKPCNHEIQALEVCLRQREKALEQRDRALEAEREKRFEAEQVALDLKNNIHPDYEHARKERDEHFE